MKESPSQHSENLATIFSAGIDRVGERTVCYRVVPQNMLSSDNRFTSPGRALIDPMAGGISVVDISENVPSELRSYWAAYETIKLEAGVGQQGRYASIEEEVIWAIPDASALRKRYINSRISFFRKIIHGSKVNPGNYSKDDIDEAQEVLSYLQEQHPKNIKYDILKAAFNKTSLDADSTAISDKVHGLDIKSCKDKIEDGTASADEVLRWYKSQDPVLENFLRGAVSEGPKTPRSDFDYLSEQASLLFKSGEIYLRKKGLADEGYQLKNGIVQQLEAGTLTADEMKNLLLGVNILSAAGQFANLALYKNNSLVSYEEFKQLGELFGRQEMILRDLTAKMFTGVFANRSVNNKEVLEYAISALMIYVGDIGFDENNPQLAKEKRKANASLMIKALSEFVLRRDLLAKWKSNGESKGKLLELLWFLDAYLYLTMRERYFVEVVPSLDHEDCPHVGLNDYNQNYNYSRASDMSIFDRETKSEFFAQLGQKGKGNKSHPYICTVRELSFIDEDEDRLYDKFEAYQAAIKSDFASEERRKAMKFILPSVVGVFSEELVGYNGCNEFRRSQGLDPTVLSGLINVKPHDVLVKFTLGATMNPSGIVVIGKKDLRPFIVQGGGLAQVIQEREIAEAEKDWVDFGELFREPDLETK